MGSRNIVLAFQPSSTVDKMRGPERKRRISGTKRHETIGMMGDSARSSGRERTREGERQRERGKG